MIQTPLAGTLEIQRGAERYLGDHGWLKTAHSFSFADYFDPQRMNWGALRVFNDDRVAPGEGFGTHPHRDMDIVTYVLAGKLEHKDSLGNHGIVERYGVQYMSAGTGVRHSEYNASKTDELHFVQMWVLPRHPGIKPVYGQQSFTAEDVAGHWLTVAAGEAGVEAPIRLDADATLRVAELREGERLAVQTGPDRLGFLFIAEGTAIVQQPNAPAVQLAAGDAVRIGPSADVLVTGPAHLVYWNVGPEPK